MDSIDKRLGKLVTGSFRSSEDPGVYFLSSVSQTGQNQKSKGESSGLLQAMGSQQSD